MHNAMITHLTLFNTCHVCHCCMWQMLQTLHMLHHPPCNTRPLLHVADIADVADVAPSSMQYNTTVVCCRHRTCCTILRAIQDHCCMMQTLQMLQMLHHPQFNTRPHCCMLQTLQMLQILHYPSCNTRPLLHVADVGDVADVAPSSVQYKTTVACCRRCRCCTILHPIYKTTVTVTCCRHCTYIAI